MVPPKRLQEMFHFAKAHWNKEACGTLDKQLQLLVDGRNSAKQDLGQDHSTVWKGGRGSQSCPANVKVHVAQWRQEKQMSVTVLVPTLAEEPWANYRLFPRLCLHLSNSSRWGEHGPNTSHSAWATQVAGQSAALIIQQLSSLQLCE